MPANMHAGIKVATAPVEPESEKVQQIACRKERDEWSHTAEFYLASIGYCVGLGNVWRFPYLCLKYGGGAFLIPYVTFLLICGVPLYLAENILGQYTGLSAILSFNFAPLTVGVGLAMVLLSGVLSIYYNVIMAWVLFFLGSSFQWDLPWSSCNNEWNTDDCRQMVHSSDIQGWTWNDSDPTTVVSVLRDTNILADASNSKSSVEEFWLYKVLNVTEEPMEMGNMNWPLFGCVVAAWILTCVCMIKGIRSTVKVVYVTAVMPYLFITIILIRGCTLPGAWIGIRFYLIPDWQRLGQLDIWTAAAKQIFYSLGPGWGGLIAFASFNKFNHNCYRASIIMPLVCCASSIYAGFAIFSVVGHMAHVTGVYDLNQLMQAGPGLAFIAYPEALSQLPGSCIWSVFFFITLLTLGLDSQFAAMENMTSGLIDCFPATLGRHKTLFIVAVCLAECLLGIPMVMQGGYYIFILMDTYSTTFSVVLIALVECFALFYLYKGTRLMRNLEDMVGEVKKWSKCFWYGAWYVLTPLSTAIVIFSAEPATPTFAGMRFPDWSITIGWLFACVSMLAIPFGAIYAVIRYRHDLKQLIRPSPDWLQRVAYRRRTFEYTFQVTDSDAQSLNS